MLLMGKSTISMAIFNSCLFVHQAGYPTITASVQVAEITVLRNRMQQMERENLRLENATWHRF